MENLKVEIELLSESIFSASEEANNSVDMEVLYDQFSIPYLKGKTFKGRLKEEVIDICNAIGMNNKSDIVENLFGKLDGNIENKEGLRFSNLSINDDIKLALKEAISKNNISKKEILDAFTDKRNFISVNEDKIVIDGSLRNVRVVKNGFKYYCSITATKKLSDLDKGILALAVKSVTSIGAMQSRGKGRVSCKLLKNDSDITKKWIENLERMVL